MRYAYTMRQSVADYLADFERLGGEQAYAERSGYRLTRWTYKDVAAMAYGFARELDRRQIRKGDRVLIWGPNSALWVAAFFGCADRGVIAVPMDHAASADFARRVFHQVQGKLVVCSRDHAQPDLPGLLLENFSAAPQPNSSEALPSANVRREDPLQIVFTSGTTAEPK